MAKKILAADIGGTNSRFAHFETDLKSSLDMVDSKWLATGEADSFHELIGKLLESEFSLGPEQADIIVIAGAGPVENKTRISPPNISWDIDISPGSTTPDLGRAVLINDFVAQAYACRSDVGQTGHEIIEGDKIQDGVSAVIGAGTGLGKAYLVVGPGGEFQAFPSEGGHCLFPFTGSREYAFQNFYRQRSGAEQITGNLVLSGKGLTFLHWFLAGEKLDPREVASLFNPDSDTLAWAAKFYGRVCREFALEVLPYGGLYVAGGIAAKNPEILEHQNFRDEFLYSPTMGHLLAKFSVTLLDNQNSGLWGAAVLGRQLLGKS